METILVHAQALVYTLLDLMPSAYQRDSLQALIGLFLDAQGHPLPQHSSLKSAGALSRFLNQYAWSTRQVIRGVRQALLEQLLKYAPKGRQPWLGSAKQVRMRCSGERSTKLPRQGSLPF